MQSKVLYTSEISDSEITERLSKIIRWSKLSAFLISSVRVRIKVYLGEVEVCSKFLFKSTSSSGSTASSETKPDNKSSFPKLISVSDHLIDFPPHSFESVRSTTFPGGQPSSFVSV